MATIVIDPGHGGTTKIGGSSANNAVGPGGTLEKTLTLALGKRAVTALKAMGHDVKITRTGDNNLGLADRAHVARNAKADVFVSIHFNASDAHNAQGTETFVHNGGAAHSERLCRALQAQLLKATGLKDRNEVHGGVKKASFGVIDPDDHHPGTAAVLTEVSFLDRADEEARLKTSTYLDAITQRIAAGIKDYLDTGSRTRSMRGAAPVEDAIDLASRESGMATRSFVAFAPAATPVAGSNKRKAKVKAPPRGGARKPRARPASEVNDVNERADLETGTRDRSVIFAPRSIIIPSNFDFAGFEALIGGLGLRHFQAREFLEMGAQNDSGSCAGTNSPPPKSLWNNIVNTALMLDEIRARLGYSMRLISVFRAAPYNTCIGGASAGFHKVFSACDFVGSEESAARWHRVAKDVRSSQARFAGGIGLYTASNFVHVDTRGSNADWIG